MNKKENFKVSVSKVKCFRTCLKLYEYRYLRKLEPKIKAKPLKFGKTVHDILEGFDDGLSEKEIWKPWRKFKKEFDKLFDEEKEYYGNMPEDVKTIMTGYMKKYKNSDLKSVSTEENIEVELVKGITFVMYYDSVVKDPQKNKWLLERKSHKNIPENDFIYTDMQTNLYLWAIEKKKGLKLSGIVWDYICSKAPSVPKLLKNGTLSKADIATTWELYLKRIKELKLDPKQYYDMRTKLNEKTLEFYKRVKVPRKTSLINQLLKEFTETAVEMSNYDGCYPRSITWTCDHCSFKDVCTGELRGLDMSSLIEAKFKPKEFDRNEKKGKKAKAKKGKKIRS
jgi:hypothetical protein